MPPDEVAATVITLLAISRRGYNDIVRACPDIPVMQLQAVLQLMLRQRRIDKCGAHYFIPKPAHAPAPYLDLIEIA